MQGISAILLCTAIAFVPTLLTGGCAASPPPQNLGTQYAAPVDAYALLDRVSWGASASSMQAVQTLGTRRWLDEQLHPRNPPELPSAIAGQISGLSIQSTPMAGRVIDMEKRRRAIDAIADEEQRKSARKDYQDAMNGVQRETATRMLLLALYSPNQLQEQMTWFWFNHFNVFQLKHDERLMLADYEQALRSHALGRFGDLLRAVVRHPAMLVYLDNAQNAVDHVNENFARELMELHTLGVDAGYTQGDVQALARVLTGFGVDRRDGGQEPPGARKGAHAGQYIRDGLFEFHPLRHDYGDKRLLGTTVRGRGPDELEQVLDLLSRHPATARHICRELARFFVADEPAPALVERMSATFRHSDGDVAQVLATLLASPEFAASLHARFKDPLRFVVSAVRLAYDGKPILNAAPMIHWLNALGEAPYNRATPDGYPLAEAAWAGPGQLTARFDIAKAIGSGSAGLFKTLGPAPSERAAFPQLANALYYDAMEKRLGAPTRRALDQAASPQEWNLLLLSSPEFMLH